VKGHRGLAGSVPRQHPPARSELHRQDHVFKTACLSIRVVGHSYNQERCWLHRWVQPESFRSLQESEGSDGRGQSHSSGVSQPLGWEHHPALGRASPEGAECEETGGIGKCQPCASSAGRDWKSSRNLCMVPAAFSLL